MLYEDEIACVAEVERPRPQRPGRGPGAQPASAVTLAAREQQARSALKLANEVRFAASRLKREVKAGEISLAAAIEDERAGCLEVIVLLTAQQGFGRGSARRVLRDELIAETKRVRELTPRQRRAIVRACA